MKKFSELHNNVKVAAGCIFDEFAKVESDVVIDEDVYVGKFSKISKNSSIAYRAVLLNHAVVSNGQKLQSGDVLLNTPTSNDLYKGSAKLDTLESE